ASRIWAAASRIWAAGAGVGDGERQLVRVGSRDVDLLLEFTGDDKDTAGTGGSGRGCRDGDGMPRPETTKKTKKKRVFCLFSSRPLVYLLVALPAIPFPPW
ncbi:MAG: hypothetical protein LBD64_05930, partial [Odoribacteraceae bacterium]|nr:hypothetical protein [Odoribacteraceae bacterium]